MEGHPDHHVPGVASSTQIGLVVRTIDQLARITRPEFHGLERVPKDGRFLLVGNHTLYGVFDVPFMVAELYKHHGLTVRSLGDHTHWKIPLWGEFLGQLGAVRGTRETTSELMRRGEPILVFPGGSREVNKRRNEAYKLMWKERIGFAQLAIEHGYPILPFAAVGAEEMLTVVADADTPVFGHASRLVDRTLGFALPSLVRGIGPTPIPRPKKLYFWFGEPIPTEPFKRDGDAGARRLRDSVKGEVEGGIELLLEVRGG
jgi:1-acyl-sn-glycerol-3-phosphate acyltransferase